MSETTATFHAFTIDTDGDEALRQVEQRNPGAKIVGVRVHPDAPRPAGWVNVFADSTVPRFLFYVEIESETQLR